jgi:poly-gamma-glutamate capsule biosynthesis protein CapA/YwtB (metallophosphatase superfamily)
MFKRILLFTSLVLVVIVSVAFYTNFIPRINEVPDFAPENSAEVASDLNNTDSTQNDNYIEDYKRSIILIAAGDIMVHSPQYTGAYIPEEDRYDFNENFTYVVPYLQKADYAVANLETTLAGQEYGYSGYPLFNSPPELVSALKEGGFNLLFTANNHSLDKGEKGIINTINHLEKAGLGFVGTARNQEEGDKIFTLFLNDLKIAFLAYTYGTNGLPIPEGKDYLINLISGEKMEADIHRAKEELEVDIIILSLHWGNEYQRVPTEEQRELARHLIEQGVDLIIGGHSHVVQPAEYIKTDHNEGLVLYSLGNFISNQRDRYCDSGVMVLIQVENDSRTNTNHVSLLEIVPTWVYKFHEQGRSKYKILPVLDQTCKDKYQGMFSLGSNDLQRLEEVPLEIRDIMQHYMDLIPLPSSLAHSGSCEGAQFGE